jgi:hypothetical protein
MTHELPSNDSIDSDRADGADENEGHDEDSGGGLRAEGKTDDARSSRRRVLQGTATLAATGIAGCSQLQDTPGEGGQDTPEEDVTDTPEQGTDADGGGGGEPTPGPEEKDPTPADCEAEPFDEDITADTTWSASDCPRVAIVGNVRVTDGATLTIEPGVEVVAREGSRLTVREEATLAASGDPETPVWFHGESETPGYWEGIRVRSNDPANSFDNAIVRNGGKNEWANIYVEGGAQASVTNTLSEQSATAGLVAEGDARLSAFATNEFRDNEGAAVYVPTRLVGSLDADSTYVGDNGTDAVGVFGRDVEEDATWPGVPYRFDGENHRINGGAVTVEPGAQLTFGEGARLSVKSGSSFTAEGTGDSPINLEGETAAPGFWEGIRVRSNDPANSFDNVEVANGGKNEWANIYVEGGAQASVTNTLSEQSATAGLVAEGDARLSEFATNEFRDNEGAAVYVPTRLVGSLDADSTYVGGNGTDAVGVFGRDVEEDATWPGVPYRFDGENHRINGGAVTVEPGAQLTFGEGARLSVKSGSSFTAEGTGDSPITFEGETASKGHWQGIRLRSNNPNNSFDNVEVAHGGANEWANIYVEGGAQASVNNSTLRESATWGIYAEDGATLEYSNVAFENNAEGGVREPGE